MKKQLIKNIFDAVSEKKRDIILLSGDLGFGVLDDFIATYPNRFFNCGISEQNMMSVAAGLGISGKTVFVYSIGNFPTLRCLEQIRNDCCYHEADVKIICVGAGMAYGALGMSHHATEDIAIMRALPDVRIYSPACASEMAAVFDDIMEKGVAYIRLGKGGEIDIPHSEPYKSGLPWAVADRGKDAKTLILTTGGIAEEAIIARETLKEKNILVDIATFPVLKPFDKEGTAEFLSPYESIITLEEHNIIGGLFGLIAELFAEKGIAKKITPLGLQDVYPSIVGDQKYLRKAYKLDGTEIVKSVLASVTRE